MHDTPEIQDQQGHIRALKKSVAHFGEPGYALIPHNKPFWRKLYANTWVVVIVFMLTLSAITALQNHASNQTLAEYDMMPNVETSAWQMIKIILLKKCQWSDQPGNPYCYLRNVTDISDQIELSYNMYKLIKLSESNRLIDFNEGWKTFVKNYLNDYYALLEEYKSYDEFLAAIYNNPQPGNQGEVLESFEMQLLTRYYYVGEINWQEVSALEGMLKSEIHRINNLFWAHGFRIYPDYWYLDHQGQFHTQYRLYPDYINPFRMVFIMLSGLLVAVIPLCLILIFTNLMMNRLSKLTPKAFYHLIIEGHLLPKTEAVEHPQNPTQNKFGIRPTSWEKYIDDLEAAITTSPWRVVVYTLLTTTLLSLTIKISEQGVVYETYNSEFYKMYMTTLLIVAIPILCYILSQYIWVLFVTARYLIWLPKYFSIRINPYEEDGSGGLRPIGDIIFTMAVILLPYCLLALFWIVSDYLAIFELEALNALFILFLPTVLILFIFLMFLSPLAVITIEMRMQKNIFEQEGEKLLNSVKEKLRFLATKDALDSPAGKTAAYQLESLEKIYPPRVHFPVWPFSNRVRLRYLAAQLLQIGSFAYGIFEIRKSIQI